MDGKFQKQVKSLVRLPIILGFLLTIVIGFVIYTKNNPSILEPVKGDETEPDTENVFIELDEETIAESGFINDKGVSQVIQNCTQCHSSKLVTQNRMSKEGWESTITWMQETQNLWDLGPNHERIVTYLAKNYGLQRKGRRQNLTNIDWYELE